MPELKDYTKLLQDPDFLASISQIVAGISGAGSVGQGIGEATRYRQKMDLEKTELQDRRSFRDRQQAAMENRDYAALVEQKHEDYTKRKTAALLDVQKTIDGMDPSDYSKLTEVLPRTLQPYQLEQSDMKQIASNALGRIQSKDWTTFDTATGKRNVEPGSSETTVYLTRKEAVKAEQDFKKEQETRRKDDERQRNVDRASLRATITATAATKEGREALRALSGPELLTGNENLLVPRVEMEGLIAGAEAKSKQEEATLRMTQVRENAMLAATERATRPTPTNDKAKLNEQEKEELANAVMLQPGLKDEIGVEGIKSIASRLVAKGFTGFGKRMGEVALVKVAESRSALRQLNELDAAVTANVDKIGPTSVIDYLNPWSDQKKIQADLERIRQNVGKAMEGGVLRAEDTVKYNRILANIWDVPSTALYKIRQVKEMMAKDIDNFVAVQEAGGRNVEGVRGLGDKATGQYAPTKDTQRKVKVIGIYGIDGKEIK